MKRSQMIELNLKYLSLKEKIDIAEITGQKVVSDNISNLSGFGDISNISEINNTSISKKSKAEELAAIKARLERLNLRRLTEKVDH
jgi:aspartate carbamoyltransferase regulatory subunit